MKKTAGGFFSSGYLILVLLFIYLPILYVIVFSFNDSKSMISFSGFSLRWYEAMLENREMLESIYYTVLVALIATAVSTVVGTVAAIGLSKARPILRSVALELNNLPVLNPDIVTAISLMLLFLSVKIQRSVVTLTVAHITFCIPYVILSVLPKLRQLDDNVAEAALDLGASPRQALMKVIIPQIYPAIFSGALIAFSMSFDDFVISFFTAGVDVQNISMYVYSMKRFNPSVNALSTLIVIAVTLILVLANLIPALRERKNKMPKEEY
ncbi:MAG: ABC transporter permease [Clostridiales bacterium]|nr:ABC transporter permease [Clostridiales bacterium]